LYKQLQQSYTTVVKNNSTFWT